MPATIDTIVPLKFKVERKFAQYFKNFNYIVPDEPWHSLCLSLSLGLVFG